MPSLKSFSLVAGSLLLFPTLAAGETLVNDLRVGVSQERARFVFDLSEAANYKVSRLADPPRLVIDMESARLATDLSPTVLNGSPALGLRHDVRNSSALRLVLDLDDKSYRVRDFSLLPHAESGRGHRLVVDLIFEGDERVAGELSEPDKSAELGTGGTSNQEIVAPAGQTAATDEPEDEPLLVRDGPADSNAAVEVAGGSQVSAGPRDPPEATTFDAEAAPQRDREIDTAISVEFSGTWQHEWAQGLDQSGAQKFESLVQPRWDIRFPGDLEITAILRIRGDAVGDLGPQDRRPPNYSDITQPWFNNGEAQLALREFYADFRVGRSDWRLGKQQVVWGQADGIKVLDVVNPQSFREFILDDFDDSRIPLWTANVNLPVGDTGNLQLLWIPDTTYHELAEQGTPFSLSTPRLLPQVPVSAVSEVKRPDGLSDGDVGFALSGFVGGWDLSLNYLYRYLDAPVLPVRIRGPQLLVLEPEYRRSHLVGGSFSTAFSDLTLRGELAYNSDTFQPTNTLVDEAIAESSEVSSVLGLDWAAAMDTLISAQWFSSVLFDHEAGMGRDKHEQQLTFLYQQDFANANWRFRGIAIHSLNDGDSQLQMRLSYWWASELQIWIGADLFDGDRRGLFGQFEEADRVLLGFEYGF